MSYNEKKTTKEIEESREDRELLLEERIAQLYSQKHSLCIAAINVKKKRREIKKFEETQESLKTEIEKTEKEISVLKNELNN